MRDPRAFRWVESGVSGLSPPRQWDAVALATCAPVGDLCLFVRESDERIIVGEGDAAVAECAAGALEGEIGAPYRAVAVRREGTTWAVGAVAIELAELPADLEGDEFVLTVTEEGERELLLNGQRSLHRLAEIAALGGERQGPFVVRAQRLEGALWEVTIDPL